MYKDIKQKWLVALRSGLFPQCRKVLVTEHKDGGFCCLGVLAMVLEGHDKPAPESKKIVDQRFGSNNLQLTMDAHLAFGDSKERALEGIVLQIPLEILCSTLPDRAAQFRSMGLTSHRGMTLPNLNDVIELNFNQIADLIEAGIQETERPVDV